MIDHFGHPRRSAPVRGQVFTGVRVTEEYGQMFIGELELCNEDSIIIGGELFLRGSNFSNFSPGYTFLEPSQGLTC